METLTKHEASAYEEGRAAYTFGASNNGGGHVSDNLTAHWTAGWEDACAEAEMLDELG